MRQLLSMLYGFAGSADLFSIKSEKKEDMRPLVRFEPLPFPRYISAGSTDTSLWTHFKGAFTVKSMPNLCRLHRHLTVDTQQVSHYCQIHANSLQAPQIPHCGRTTRLESESTAATRLRTAWQRTNACPATSSLPPPRYVSGVLCESDLSVAEM